MAKTVSVSLLHPMKLVLGDETFHYKAGMREMPYAHAEKLGVLRRIRGEVVAPDTQAPAPSHNPLYVSLGSVLDEKTAAALTKAGYSNLAEVNEASRDTLLSVEGIGPARYEEIQAVLGRRMSDDGEEA